MTRPVIKSIYQSMVSSGLNEVVGGGDPKVLGETNANIIEQLMPIKPGIRVLDFGCGCGRVALPVLERLGSSGSLVGIDIIPDMVEFCTREIVPQFPNSEFYQLKADNSHYTDWQHRRGASANTIESLAALDEGSFDLVFAFSVFTHLGKTETIEYLTQIAKLLKPNGRAILSVLFINQSSQTGNRLGLSNVPFGRSLLFRKSAYYANSRDKLASVGYRESTFIKMSVHAGLDVSQIYYGAWPGRRERDSYQDMISLQPRPKLPKHFNARNYIQKNSDLPFDPATREGQISAARHYLSHGYFEGREF